MRNYSDRFNDSQCWYVLQSSFNAEVFDFNLFIKVLSEEISETSMVELRSVHLTDTIGKYNEGIT